ncbi:PhzF family phenazine biosynthesis protein [Baekduia alba]|uniref:PhzF family phenazine biosynthesis protein n=1 Tax=Baekduia alba TaxID=2997333 RepID=UPI003D78E6CA
MWGVPALPFALVDVFATTPLAGNPLAVVLDADALPDATLQQIARELNQSETTFVLPPRDPSVTLRLRSFTADGSEVTGAGHNALGAWWWLAETGRVEVGGLRQELGDAVLDLEISRAGERLEVAMRQAAPTVGAAAPVAALAAPLGLAVDQLRDGGAQVVSTGAAHLLVEARDEQAVDAARPDAPALAAALADAGAQGCYLFARRAPGADAAAYARFFNPTVGLWEDPATGSAAGPLAWWIAGSAGPARIGIDQGHALGRPSRIAVAVDGDAVTLRGSAVLTGDGNLHIPEHEDHA